MTMMIVIIVHKLDFKGKWKKLIYTRIKTFRTPRDEYASARVGPTPSAFTRVRPVHRRSGGYLGELLAGPPERQPTITVSISSVGPRAGLYAVTVRLTLLPISVGPGFRHFLFSIDFLLIRRIYYFCIRLSAPVAL